MEVLYFALSAIAGYLLNRSFFKNGTKINNKLPFLKITFIQFSPHIKIHLRGGYIHIHHWITYTIILIITFTGNFGLLDSLISKGYLIGGILQGLTFPDWKKVIIKKL